jgi:hypothetical protein
MPQNYARPLSGPAKGKSRRGFSRDPLKMRLSQIEGYEARRTTSVPRTRYFGWQRAWRPTLRGHPVPNQGSPAGKPARNCLTAASYWSLSRLNPSP